MMTTEQRRECRGFLYGHYDSRGGTTMIEAKTKEEADQRYLKDVFCYSDQDILDFGGLVAQEDFLGEAILSTPVTLNKPQELDNKNPSMVFWLTGETLYDSDENEEASLPDEGQTFYRLWHSPDGTPPPEPAVHPRWDDDALLLSHQGRLTASVGAAATVNRGGGTVPPPLSPGKGRGE